MNGMIEPHSEPRIYLNTNVFIEIFERGGAVSDSLLRLFAGPQRPRYHIVTSQLTIAEVLVAPIRDDDMQRHDLVSGVLTGYSEPYDHCPDQPADFDTS